MTTKPVYIEHHNLSIAWVQAMQAAIELTGSDIGPLVVSITGFVDGKPPEDLAIRQTLDMALTKKSLATCGTVASTIFPYSMWNRARSRSELFERYLRSLPKIQKSHPQNRYGTYFGRMIAFGDKRRNQLDCVIQTYKRGIHRRSALQISIFNPLEDQTGQPMRGFPCLQQIAFGPDHKHGELTITGFYATQYLFDRAYGNYLGLCRLGEFVAHELGLHLIRMNCIASVALRGNLSKSSGALLLDQMGRSNKLVPTKEYSQKQMEI